MRAKQKFTASQVIVPIFRRASPDNLQQRDGLGGSWVKEVNLNDLLKPGGSIKKQQHPPTAHIQDRARAFVKLQSFLVYRLLHRIRAGQAQFDPLTRPALVFSPRHVARTFRSM